MSVEAAVPSREPRRFPGKLVVLGIGAAIVLLVAILGTGIALAPPVPELPHLGTLPAFHLTDEQGRPFGPEQVAGKVLIANFVFTRCPSVCPTLTQKMAAVQHELEEKREQVRLVSFSVDPAWDTPERLKEYGAKFGQDPEVWSFVTGDAAAVKAAVEQGFKVGVDGLDVPGAEPKDIVHSEHFVLVDPDGSIRGYYPAEKRDLTRMTMDVGRILGERKRK